MPTHYTGYVVWSLYDTCRTTPAASKVATKGSARARQGARQVRSSGEEDNDGYQEECKDGQYGELL